MQRSAAQRAWDWVKKEVTLEPKKGKIAYVTFAGILALAGGSCLVHFGDQIAALGYQEGDTIHYEDKKRKELIMEAVGGILITMGLLLLLAAGYAFCRLYKGVYAQPSEQSQAASTTLNPVGLSQSGKRECESANVC